MPGLGESTSALWNNKDFPYRASGIFTLRTASAKGYVFYGTDCLAIDDDYYGAPLAGRMYAVWFLEGSLRKQRS